ncbi:hypothetical protein FRC06_005300, partial [Ceratobasidium sp. 370]
MSGFCKQKLTDADDEDDDDEFDFCIDFDEKLADPADIDETDAGDAPLWTLHDNEELLSEIDLPEIEPGLPEGLEVIRAGRVIWKVAKFAHKIQLSPRPCNFFKEQCEEREVEWPHNMQCDQLMCWNSTEQMTQDANRTFLAIIVTQAEPSFRIPCLHRLRKDDQKYIKGLNGLLKPLSIVSDIFSHAGIPLLADVILHFDSLNYMYTNITNNLKEPMYVWTGAEHAQVVLNKYYQMTDNTHLYCMGMLLHPSLCKHYMKKAHWELDHCEG